MTGKNEAEFSRLFPVMAGVLTDVTRVCIGALVHEREVAQTREKGKVIRESVFISPSI